jgi:hypothetical protein
MPAGYSGNPLAAKLGLRPGLRAWHCGMPDSVAAELAEALPEAAFEPEPRAGLDFAHVFTASRAELESALVRLRPLLAQAGTIWVSWPKKASKVPTDITEDTIREVALPLGLVDVKVCAVDTVWSGLKLVIRKELRR